MAVHLPPHMPSLNKFFLVFGKHTNIFLLIHEIAKVWSWIAFWFLRKVSFLSYTPVGSKFFTNTRCCEYWYGPSGMARVSSKYPSHTMENDGEHRCFCDNILSDDGCDRISVWNNGLWLHEKSQRIKWFRQEKVPERNKRYLLAVKGNVSCQKSIPKIVHGMLVFSKICLTFL